MDGVFRGSDQSGRQGNLLVKSLSAPDLMTYWTERENALCNLSRNKLRKATAATSGPSRRWFRLSITMEVEARNRIAEQYKMPLLLRLQEVYRGKVVEDGKKCLCIVSQLTGRWKKYLKQE